LCTIADVMPKQWHYLNKKHFFLKDLTNLTIFLSYTLTA